MEGTATAAVAALDSAAPVVQAAEAPTKPETVTALETVPPWKQKLQEHVRAREEKLRPAAKPVAPSLPGEAATGKKPEALVSAPDSGSTTPAPGVPKPATDDDLSIRLAELAKQARTLAERERALRDREKSTATAHQADIDLANKLRAASSTGRRLDLLRAAGVSEEQIRGSWVLDLLQELQESDAGAPGMTEQQTLELFAKQQREQQEQAAKQRQAAKEAKLTADRESYFGGVGEVLKAGDYPLVRAIRPTLHELDVELTAHFSSTGVALTPAELLSRFEARYKAAGVTIQVAAPAPKPQAARAVTAEMLSDGGGRVEDVPGETYREKTDRLRAEMRKRFPRK